MRSQSRTFLDLPRNHITLSGNDNEFRISNASPMVRLVRIYGRTDENRTLSRRKRGFISYMKSHLCIYLCFCDV
ncbi:hypothetical protein Bca4012_062584 [Brassica carinata]|uniref:Uncharacterized protein n=1 Tax=Brassica carinata TaxID=52824 RepID=A0A8X7QG47_BRACI|nr:hypothetical protein Bca52824_064112 [Brassica carinata]